jgi:ActR/RegA family two-component response regulator
MSSILLVDEDVVSRDVVAGALRERGFDVHTAAKGAAGVDIARRVRPGVSISEMTLGEMSAVELVENVRRVSPGTVCMIATAQASTASVVACMRAGAWHCLDKPIMVDALVGAITSAQVLNTAPQTAHALERWARAVVGATMTERDPRTLQEWGRSIGVSVGGLRSWCYTAGIQARQSLIFARLLRASLIGAWRHERLENLLDVVDRRTLQKMLAMSGAVETDWNNGAHSVEQYLTRQTIVTNPNALREVRRDLARYGIVCPERGEQSDTQDAAA